jgi:hypothetical protein
MASKIFRKTLAASIALTLILPATGIADEMHHAPASTGNSSEIGTRKEYTAIDLKTITPDTSLTGSHPKAIALAAFGVKEPIEGNFQEKVTVSYLKRDRALAILVQLGLPDDSVRGFRYRLEFQRQGNERWRLVWAGRQQACWPGRGHEEFGKAACR